MAANAQSSTVPVRKYPGLPDPGDTVESHTAFLKELRQSILIHQRETGDTDSSFVRLGELIDLGLIQIKGTRILDLVNTEGDILVRQNGKLRRLGVGTEGQVLKIVDGVPAWATP